jgi:uncharacterized repeat protein (TIGR01451 family)
MKAKSEMNIFRVSIFPFFLALSILILAFTGTTTAKSLYVIADMDADPQPVQAYDIGVDSSLTYQSESKIEHWMYGAEFLAIDTDNERLFVTYRGSNRIGLVDAKTMAAIGSKTAPGASDLAGIVYDNDKDLLYCIERGSSWLYVYSCNPETNTLSYVQSSPFSLRRATGYGIALDEANDMLYVANGTSNIYAYDTSEWELQRTIAVSRTSYVLAVDEDNGYLYSGGGYADNHYLTQFNLDTSVQKEVQVESNAGVMGLGVDKDTDIIYLSTGNNNASGGDNLLVYDSSLKRIYKVSDIGKPSGLVVPQKDVGFNPLNLEKEITEGIISSDDGVCSVEVGGSITYSICFDNLIYDDVNEIMVIDTLPAEVSFVSATAYQDGVYGEYDSDLHIYTWLCSSLEHGETVCFDITVQVNGDVELGASFKNYATIVGQTIPSTTTGIESYTADRTLHIRKSVVGAFADDVVTVDPGENVTYRIHFDNNDNDFLATEVVIVDFLPDELSFVSADYDQSLGFYDAAMHTYTWYYLDLQPGDATNVKLTARVNDNVIPGTTVTNSVVIDCDETSEAVADTDILVTGTGPINSFSLSKEVDGAVGDIYKVNLDEEVTYLICVDANNIAEPIAGVTVTDYLPDEVSFVSAEGGDIIGQYNAKTHTYTWSYPYISPGDIYYLEITVRVNQDVAFGKAITNIVDITSAKTVTVTASTDIVTDEGGWQVEDIQIIPDTIRRDSSLSGIIAVLEMPEGIKISDIKEEPLVLTPGGIKSDPPIVIETDGKVKVVAVFDKNQVMEAIPKYGEVELEIVGQFNFGQSYYGEATITITRFAD